MKKHIAISSLIVIMSMFITALADAETENSLVSEAKTLTESALKTAESDNFSVNLAFIGAVEKFQRKTFLVTPASPEESDVIKKACGTVAKAAIVVKENLERNVREDSEGLPRLEEELKKAKPGSSDKELLERSIECRTFNIQQYGVYQKRLEAVIKKLTDQSK